MDESTSGTIELSRKTKLYVYISQFLSAWGDRMWSFGVGLFLIELAPESLRLTATYGFSSGGAILLFGAIVGDWVDNTPRLKAARLALIIQNSSVIVCAAVVFVVYWFNSEIEAYWADRVLLRLCHAVIIIIAIISNLSSIARKIAIEKDWLVEICGKDKDLLASMSATMRCIDQTSMILAPVLTGQVIAFANLGYGAVFIGAWNLFSVVVEYFLIWKVYENVPALKNKMYRKRKDKDTAEVDNNEKEDKEEPMVEISFDEDDTVCETQKDLLHKEDENIKVDKNDGDKNKQIEKKKRKSSNTEMAENSCRDGCTKILRKMFKSFITLYKGWRIYIKYDVAFAGLGLACLYMTVLGFDNITVGYAYSQGLSESVLGGLMAAGAIAGILGTVAYPSIRKCVGLQRTGLFGLGSEILCLCACVAAVWAPGSPFDPYYWSRSSPENQTMTTNQPHDMESSSTISPNSSLYSVQNSTYSNISLAVQMIHNVSLTNQTSGSSPDSSQKSYISVGLFLGGIITARFGLWLSDLTISQLFLESVVETERGIVNGVQNSLNKLMDMLKFLLVILVPQPELFGYLILISFSFICLGWVFYAKYSHSARGHLFHFDKVRECLQSSHNHDNNKQKDREEVEEENVDT